MTTACMLDSRAIECADYLSGLDRTTARPVVVTIDGESYPGAYYAQERDASPGCRAYADGERTYVHRALYLLGERPAISAKTHGYVLTGAHVQGEVMSAWYSAGYWTPNDFQSLCYVRESDGTTRPQTIEDIRPYHPLGAHFLIMRDDVGVLSTNAYGAPRRSVKLALMHVREIF